MAWAMAAVSGIVGGMAKGLQTGYQDSANNNAVGSAIPQRMQNFMGVPMQRLNDKIMADRQTQSKAAAAAANRQKAMSMVSGNYGSASGNSIVGAGVGIMGGTNRGYARSTGGSQYMPGMEQRTAVGVGMNGSRGFRRRQEARQTPEKVYETQEFAGSDFQSQAGYATPPPPGFEHNMTPEHAAKRAMGIARGWDREKAASVGAII
jgi:hypothetical protein